MSLGIPGQLSHPKVVEAKQKVLKAVLQKDWQQVFHMVQPSTALSDCEAAVKEGYTFVAVGTDILF
jgi:2-keto-3-deoxy-L-rhamnonate aldolase RhmA